MKDFIQQITKEAGQIGMEYFRKGVTSKTKANRSDYLTEADLAISNFFVKKIKEKFPNHGIHTEELEKDLAGDGEYEWVIDPIDGTFNFALGIPLWCILVAVLEKGEAKYAAAYSPMSQELLFAEKGHGATLNGETVSVGEHAEIRESRGYAQVSPGKPTTDRFVKFMAKAIGHGARCVNHCDLFVASLVATGKLDFYVSTSGHDHDHMAPKLICEEAGAVVTDVNGEPWKRGVENIVVANPVLHAKIMDLLR